VLAAAVLGTVETVSVVEVSERTWPDERLGCLGRRGILDPVPVPAYRILLALGGRSTRSADTSLTVG
jgi:hypothetical protein